MKVQTPTSKSTKREKITKAERLAERRTAKNSNHYRGRAKADAPTRAAKVTDEYGHDLENPT